MSFWEWVIPTLATVGGAVLRNNGVQAAAATSAAATNRATDAQLQGLALSQKTIAQQQAAASPGLVQMQNLAQRGDALQPAQITALDEARRTTLDSLRGSGLRGSARATAATVKKVDGDMRNTFLQSNQQRSDTAASGLSSQYFNAGNNLANNQTATGTAVSNGLTSMGDINASSQLGQSTTTGKAIGDIGAILADEAKKRATS